MLIAAVGDTHGRIDNIEKELKRKKVDYLMFTGDYYSDALRLARLLKIEFTGVTGNCDTGKRGKDEQIVDIGGCRFYITHGHRYGVKQGGLNNLYYRGSELKANAILFGHTHASFCECIENIWLINPGSPSRPRFNTAKTYALINIDESGVLFPDIIELG